MEELRIQNLNKENIKELLYDFVDFGLVIFSPEGLIETCNKSFEKITGSTIEELIGTTGEQLNINIPVKSKSFERLEDRKKGISEKYRIQIKSKNQSTKWLSVNSKPRFNEHGEFIGTFSFVEDISDYIHTEVIGEIIDELTKGVVIYEHDLKGFLGMAHQLIKRIIPSENMVIAFGLTDKTLWFPYIQDQNLTIQRNEFRTDGCGLTEFVMKNDKSLILDEVTLKQLRMEEQLTSFDPIPKSQLIVPIKTDKDVIGALRCYSYTEKNLYDNTSLEILGKIGVGIGPLIEKIRVNSERKMFMELSDIPVVIVNRDGFFEYVNPTFLNKMGFEKTKLLHQPFADFIHPKDRSKYHNAIELLQNGKSLDDVELKLVNVKNEAVWFSWFAQPQMMNVSFYFVGRDITAQKQGAKINDQLLKRLGNLIRNFKESVVFIDNNGLIMHVNKGLCDMLGYKAEELLGKMAIDMLHPEHLHASLNKLYDKRKRGPNDRYETEYLTKTGQTVWGNLSLTTEFDENGIFIGVVGIITDVSKEIIEKQRKERLLRLHKSFFTLNEAITRGYDLEQIQQTVLGILQSTFNINVSRIYHVKEDLMSGQYGLTLGAERMKSKSLKKLSTIFPNGIRDLKPEISKGSPYDYVIEGNAPLFLKGKDNIYNSFSSLNDDPAVDDYKAILSFMKIEFYALFPVNHFNEMYCMIECVSENNIDEGEIDDIMAFMQQVNVLIDKKLGDIALIKNEKRWRGLIENSSEITCILDKGGRITFASPSVERMLGFTINKILNSSIFDFIHPEDREVAEEKFRIRLEEGGEGFYQVLRIKNHTGTYNFFRVYTSNHIDKEEIDGLIVNAQDITDMVNSENEKYLSIIETEENERKRISRDLHDGVGQYLAATNMYMNLLEMRIEDQFDDNTKKLFEKTAEILLKATTEVRSVSHNIMPPSLKDFGFIECVKGLVEGLSQASKDIEFTLTEKVQLKDMPEWMGLTLFRAIQQILNNAISHGQPKKIKVLLEMRNKQLFIEISDDGLGFDHTKINDHQGIGILSIRHRIQSVGGQTIIKSKPGEGTSFSILASLNTIT